MTTGDEVGIEKNTGKTPNSKSKQNEEKTEDETFESKENSENSTGKAGEKMSYKKLNGEQCYVQKADGEWGKESFAQEKNI